jgi:asparagine synthase (glutamine-hydrolysing)
MCGFAGFISRSNDYEYYEKHLNNMGNAISHRGPDDSGIWCEKELGVGLTHRRLAILDTSLAGHQPMSSFCERFVIVFNGEIYNHLILRKKLLLEGVTVKWRGHSDTETLLSCFVMWGVEKTLKLSVGMFAFALWDKKNRELILARDRMGEKPLYWGWQSGVLLFGSELKALKAHPAFNSKIDKNALTLLMRHNYIPAPYSIYNGIQKLTPGNFVTISLGAESSNDVILTPYWKTIESVHAGLNNPFMGSDEEAISSLESNINESISGQMLSDVPLGAFLSGGVDSSLIVALMQQQSRNKIRTFSVGFDLHRFNEAEYAKAVANHIGTDHTELYVSELDALSVIPELPTIYDEPFADSSQIPTFLVSKMARKHVSVAITGDGGDELFGGYNPYQFAPRIWSMINKIPRHARILIHASLRHLPLPVKVRKLVEILHSKSKEDFYRALVSHWNHPRDLIINAIEPITYFTSDELWPNTENFSHWMMVMDSLTYMPDDILVKVDRAAMANSLETRVPLLDHRVIDFAHRLPMHFKIREGKGKWVLRELLFKHVPRELIDRPKMGFSVPLGEWLRGPLRGWGEEMLDEFRLREQGYFNAKLMKNVWLDHQKGRADHSSKLWGVLMFQAWLTTQNSGFCV